MKSLGDILNKNYKKCHNIYYSILKYVYLSLKLFKFWNSSIIFKTGVIIFKISTIIFKIMNYNKFKEPQYLLKIYYYLY